jgi:hypothetical protein
MQFDLNLSVCVIVAVQDGTVLYCTVQRSQLDMHMDMDSDAVRCATICTVLGPILYLCSLSSEENDDTCLRYTTTA